MKTPSSGPRRSLRLAGGLLILLVAASAFVVALAVLGFFSATFGGPAMVQLGELLSGR